MAEEEEEEKKRLEPDKEDTEEGIILYKSADCLSALLSEES